LFIVFTPSQTFRWADPNSWPWNLKIWLGFVLVSWLLPAWRWLQRERQKSWPTANGRIDSAHIGEPKRFLGLTLPASSDRKCVAVLAYSYLLSGQTFQGEYRTAVASEADAEEFLRGLRGQAVSVQYNPNNSARSVILPETVEALLRNRPPLLNAPEWKNPLPAWSKSLIGALASLALIGLLLSIWVHIDALFGREPSSGFWGLHVGLFIVFGPAVFVAQRRLGTTQSKDFWKAVTKGSPDGVRYMLYVFLGYAFITGTFTFVQSPPGVVPSGSSASYWRSFSTIWMVFYYSSFAILSSTYRSFSDRP